MNKERHEGRMDGLEMASDLAKAVILKHGGEGGICHGCALVIAAISLSQKRLREEYVEPNPERRQVANPSCGEPGGYPG